MWIHEGMTAFPKLKLKTVPGMDPIMQFQQTESVPDGDLGMARVDVSVSCPCWCMASPDLLGCRAAPPHS